MWCFLVVLLRQCRYVCFRFAFIEFPTPEAAQKSHDEMQGQEVDGRAMTVDYAAEKGAGGGRGGKCGRYLRARNYQLFLNRTQHLILCVLSNDDFLDDESE